MGKLIKLMDEHLEEYIASLLFVLFTALMFSNVVMRYVFQDAIPWAEEMTLLLFIWFVWFAIPFATKLDSHAKVSFIQDWLPGRIKALLNIFLAILTIVIFVSIIVAAIEFLNHNAVKGKTGLLVPYPMWLFYLPAPIGLALTVYRLLSKLNKDFYTLIHSSKISKGG
jgi:TRAP-type C4-dicarboxylate transport system permease small subunit